MQRDTYNNGAILRNAKCGVEPPQWLEYVYQLINPSMHIEGLT